MCPFPVNSPKFQEMCFARTVQEEENPPATEPAIPIAIHLLGPRDLLKGLPTYFQAMNETFQPMGVRFYLSSVQALDPVWASELGVITDLQDYEDILVTGALNIVVGAPIDPMLAGRANFGVGFVVRGGMSVEIWIHELGHGFGLYHTHEFSYDATQRGEDCIQEGDRICDTPVDPGPYFCHAPLSGDLVCETPKFPEEDYGPDPTNYMSYYQGRDHFSQGQYAAMRCFLDQGQWFLPLSEIDLEASVAAFLRGELP